MRRIFIFLVFLIFQLITYGQELGRVTFDLASMSNPQYFSHAFFYKDNYVSLSRVKGRPNKKSIYSLSSRSKDFSKNWEQQLHFGDKQHIVNFMFCGDSGLILKNSYDLENKISFFLKGVFDLNSGKITSFDTICLDSIKTWFDFEAKAKVKQDFHNAVQSIQYPEYSTPIEYKYQLEFSPDSSKILIYQYDYSEKKLSIKAKVFNSNFQELERGRVPVDAHHICYGLHVDNSGAIILYKVSESGRVVAVRSKLNSKKFDYVDLYTANSTRDNLKLIQQDTSSIYIAKLNRKNGSFVGLTYSKFDFDREEITETRYQPFEQSFKNELLDKMKAQQIPYLDKNWYHFELTDFIIDKDSNRIVIVEERNIVSNEYEYLPESVEKKQLWNPMMGRVKAGVILIWVFDKDNKLIYKEGLLKNQEIDATDGLNTVSYKVQLLLNNKIRFVLTEEGKGNILNQIRIKEIDYSNGNTYRSELLSNPQKLVLTRPYTIIRENILYFVGRKGLFGKKTYLVKYKL